MSFPKWEYRSIVYHNIPSITGNGEQDFFKSQIADHWFASPFFLCTVTPSPPIISEYMIDSFYEQKDVLRYVDTQAMFLLKGCAYLSTDTHMPIIPPTFLLGGS
jgi:hypothetical protein